MSCPKKIGTYLEVHGLKTPFLAVFPDFSGEAKAKVKVQNCTLHFAIYSSKHGLLVGIGNCIIYRNV